MFNVQRPGDRPIRDDDSSELSSSPISLSSTTNSPHRELENIYVRPAIPRSAQLDGVGDSAATPAAPAATTTAPAEKPKRPRKKKEVGPDGKPIDDGKPKEKKPRKPREPKDKTATNGTAANPRKKIKLEEKAAPSEPAASRKLGLFDLLEKPVDKPPRAVPAASSSLQPPASISRPVSATQRYDPVRAAMMEAMNMGAPSQGTTTPQTSTSFVNRASASPSIASLIDPPPKTSSNLTSPRVNAMQPSPQNTTSFATQSVPQSPSPMASRTISTVQNTSEAMDVGSAALTVKADPVQAKSASKPASSAPTPKQALNKSSPPAAKGTGSGLLSTSDLFGGSSSAGTLERKGVNIDIHITLDPAGSNHINVAQEIIKKYGRDALNPRAAAHREEVLSVMYAGKNLGTGSADDMSLDLGSDLEDDSNVEMGGMNDTADDDKPKRRKKVEEYDLEDDFIDDTELAWQQQAAVAKDGFFVYSGPLRSESEKAAAEAAASSTRGGRGRGRGRGRGGAATTHASLAEKKETAATTTATGTPARGRGSRGGRGAGAARKPRATKADKEAAEKMRVGQAMELANKLAASTSAVASAVAAAIPQQQNGLSSA